MSKSDFAITCDSGCDLSPAFFEKTGVEVVALDDAAASAEELVGVFVARYRALAERGFSRIISVHSTPVFSEEIAAARAAAQACAGEADVRVVDSGSASAATGMVVFRLAYHQAHGVPFERAVEEAERLAACVRLLVVPTTTAPFARRRRHQAERGIIGRATLSLRANLIGERGLFLLSRSEVTQLARSTDLSDLTGRLARSMSSVFSVEGPLVHAAVVTGDVRAQRALEKPLDTNEFESQSLGVVRVTPGVEGLIGAGAVGVAFAPADAYWREPVHDPAPAAEEPAPAADLVGSAT